jgi:hypothetical protein
MMALVLFILFRGRFDGSNVVDLTLRKHKIKDTKIKASLNRILEAAHLGCLDPIGRPNNLISPAIRSTAKKG